MDIDRFTAVADRLMGQVPPPILEGLNGGVTIRRRAMRRPDDPPGIYILGEYVTDEFLGCYVVLYYGSFRALFADEPDESWEREIWDTIRHELRHHVEGRAGVVDLDLEDEADLERFQEEAEDGPLEPRVAPRKFRLKRPLRRRPADT
jgi:hypothetical protein